MNENIKLIKRRGGRERYIEKLITKWVTIFVSILNIVPGVIEGDRRSK